MLVVLLSALANTGSILLDKFILSRQKMKLSDYIPLLFAFLFIITLVTLPWLGAVNSILAFNRIYIFFVVLMALLAIMWNILYYQGLRKEKLVEFELTTPLVTVLMAALFFPEEFNIRIFLASIVGSLALFISHLKKSHFQFNKYAIHLLLAVVLIAMESMVQRELLYVYSPAALYALRTGMLALFFAAYYRPKMHDVHDQNFKTVFATAFMGTFFMITRLYGFESLGVTLTTLVLLLSPILVTWFDAKVNGTQIKPKTFVAFGVILVCVLYAAMQQLV
jgi:drug/metabolite transporter (DMT)-like permease